MSTRQTDAHNEGQEAIFENFCSLVDIAGYAAGQTALDQMTESDDVDPKTYAECKTYLRTIPDPRDTPDTREDDPDSRGQELQEQAEERQAERMEAHFYPSEGPARY